MEYIPKGAQTTSPRHQTKRWILQKRFVVISVINGKTINILIRFCESVCRLGIKHLTRKSGITVIICLVWSDDNLNIFLNLELWICYRNMMLNLRPWYSLCGNHFQAVYINCSIVRTVLYCNHKYGGYFLYMQNLSLWGRYFYFAVRVLLAMQSTYVAYI